MHMLYHWTWLPISFVQEANRILSRLGLPTITPTNGSGIRLFDAMGQMPREFRRQALIVLEICWDYYHDQHRSFDHSSPPSSSGRETTRSDTR